jgi:hypothetical protein
MDAFLMRIMDGPADLNKKRQAVPVRQLVQVAVIRNPNALN